MKRLAFGASLLFLGLTGCGGQGFVGALGAGSDPSASAGPSEVSKPADSPSGTPSASPTAETTKAESVQLTPTEVDVPPCDGRIGSPDRSLTFECPTGWFLWRLDDSGIIISNHRPMSPGRGGLPNGWFKVDFGIIREPGVADLSDLRKEICKATDWSNTAPSCEEVDIGSTTWIRAVSNIERCEYRWLGTVENGMTYYASGIVPNGSAQEAGREIVESLFETIRLRVPS